MSLLSEAPAPARDGSGGAPPSKSAVKDTGGRGKRRNRFWRFLAWLLAIVVVIALVVAGLGVWTVTRSFPQTRGTLEVVGLEQSVTVQRDDRGIPTITAETSHDLFFSQGFVHAQDRFWEMDFRRHLTSARLSELFGESQIGTDTFLRSLGWHAIAEEEVKALPTEVRDFYEAYAEGVNAYLDQRSGAELSLEYAVLGLQNAGYSPEPWTPADSVAWFKAMAWDLRTNIEDETARALVATSLDQDQIAELYPGYDFSRHPVILADDPAGEAVISASSRAGSGRSDTPNRTTGQLSYSGLSALLAPLNAAISGADTLLAPQGEGVGSNSWVVSGEHTDTGKPLLANDPHLGAALPSVWTQLQLRCATVSVRCPFDVTGYSFSGLPGIVIGHNAHMAWGFTNLTTDVADLYIERIDGNRYFQDGEWHDLTTRSETLKVAGGEDVTIEVRSTKHGPIVSGLTGDFTSIAKEPRLGVGFGAEQSIDQPAELTAGGINPDTLPGEYAVALRWTALDAGGTAEAIFDMNLATNFTDFRAAASKFDVPAQNLIYADPKGNIGYQAPGRLPIRGAGDGWLPQPGWDSAFDWQGSIPFDELPWTYNPDSGYIVTANNAIVNDDYPYFLSRDWDYGYRAARIVELIEERLSAGPVTAKDLRDIQFDNQSPVAQSLVSAYAGLTVTGSNPRLTQALELLAGWDGQNAANSNAAAFANVLWSEVTALMVGGKSATIPRDDQSRFATFFEEQLQQPNSAWWQNSEAGVETKDALLERAAENALSRLTELQGGDPAAWNWGALHALELRNGTFGESGIAPIEALFNRGPFPASGGSGVVNATGWGLDDAGFGTVTVPSMRMVVDTSDWDASTWNNLTGASGHAFHPHYVDQTKDWSLGVQQPWAFSKKAVDAATRDTLTLSPSA